MNVEFYRHNLGEKELEGIKGVIDSVFLSTGSQVKEFEERFARNLSAKNMVGTISGTAALHLALIALGIGPEDAVITTPMTFVATANAILYTGAIPLFVDVLPTTGNIDVSLIEGLLKKDCTREKDGQVIHRATGKRIRGILPVHLYGQMCNMVAMRELADEWGLIIVEDSAHCVEGMRDNIRPGGLSDAACFSFYATKNITSGEGGGVICNDDGIDERLRVLRLHGMDKSAADRYSGSYRHWDMEVLGWKYNMYNLQAALLISQLDEIDERLKRREEIAHAYTDAFLGHEGIGMPEVIPDSRHARHLFTIWVDPKKRDEIISRLNEGGIGAAVNYRAIHLLIYYRKRFGYKPGDFPIAERIGGSTISLPFYPKLTSEEVSYVIDGVVEALG